MSIMRRNRTEIKTVGPDGPVQPSPSAEPLTPYQESMKQLADTVNYLLKLFIFFKFLLPAIIMALFLVVLALIYIIDGPPPSWPHGFDGGVTGPVGQ